MMRKPLASCPRTIISTIAPDVFVQKWYWPWALRAYQDYGHEFLRVSEASGKRGLHRYGVMAGE